MLPAANRLRTRRDFSRVHRQGRRVTTEAFSAVAGRSGQPHVRVGISASRKLGGAVIRNRARRRLREAVRPLLQEIRPGWDVAFSARIGAVEVSWGALRQMVCGSLRELGVLPPIGAKGCGDSVSG